MEATLAGSMRMERMTSKAAALGTGTAVVEAGRSRRSTAIAGASRFVHRAELAVWFRRLPVMKRGREG